MVRAATWIADVSNEPSSRSAVTRSGTGLVWLLSAITSQPPFASSPPCIALKLAVSVDMTTIEKTIRENIAIVMPVRKRLASG